ncbi:glutamate--cysteine ligase [Streptomyces buecherae]|uniref:Putative glutamate--cysteine ligase 2 n=1 Tax=Streptomyces buecherae TaxID=2763006 RepID=A0A7H8N8I5_9ACTN|nr:glutamate--cysteine ligase [Streptomyces buecherae]QKW50834.1 glutamate--cysteine ligase [Streptomyces buecherae]
MAQPLTVGVEEEFFLVDPDSGAAVPAAEQVLAAAEPTTRVKLELSAALVETVTEPHRELRLLAADLRGARAEAAAAAEAVGCAVLPSATELLAGPCHPPTGGARNRRIHARYGAFVDGRMTCGLHVHVGMPDRERAVRVGNHLRPWLPVLHALSANSPFSQGQDTGFASFRSMWWAYKPVAGPAPLFRDAAEYDALLDRLIASGVILDRKMAFWFARPSEHVPTIEVRVMDVCPTSDTAVLLAGLTRGLVATCLAEVERDGPPPAISDVVLAAAHWQAAAHGLEGDAVDVVTALPVPVWTLVERLVKHIAPALSEAGDLDWVEDALSRTRGRGSWAAHQRGIVRAGGGLPDVAARLRGLLLT